MAYDIIHKNSTVTGTPPTPSEIELGEIAVQAADAELYIKDTSNDLHRFLNETDTVTAIDNAIIAANFTQTGIGAVSRTYISKLADVVSVKDFGATGDGTTDDTTAIENAVAAASTIYFPTGIYVLTADFDATLLNKNTFGPGQIKYNNLLYPAERKVSQNYLWAGQFNYWPMGFAKVVSSVERVQIPAGVTVARNDLDTGCTISKTEGLHTYDALRIQRNAGNSSSKYGVLALNLSEAESRPLVGNDVVLQFHAYGADNFSGSMITAQILYSVEQEQAIIGAEGRYSSGSVTAATANFTPAANPRLAPFWITASIPSDATQVAVRLTVPFSGTAGTEDAVTFENVTLCVGSQPVNTVLIDAGAVVNSGRTRYQSSYPYGVARGSSTSQGNVIGIAHDTGASWSFAINVPFSPPMLGPPKFFFQHRFSSTESRLWDEDASSSINGLAYNLSPTGVNITNNGVTVAGNRYSTNWTAEVIF